MSIYRKEALNPSERNSPFIFGKIQTAPAAINNREKVIPPKPNKLKPANDSIYCHLPVVPQGYLP